MIDFGPAIPPEHPSKASMDGAPIRAHSSKRARYRTALRKDRTARLDCTNCSVCSGTDDGPLPQKGLLRGGRFVLASVGLFLAPIVLAILGAAWCGESVHRQVFGAIGGLGLGMVGAVAIARVLHVRGEAFE